MFYRKLGVLFLSLVLVGCAGGRGNRGFQGTQSLPQISDAEIVGIVYGETYTYGQLKATDAGIRDMLPFTFDPELAKSRMRGQAIVAFREIVLHETVRREFPACDVNVSSDETAQYIDWWHAAVISIERSLPESHRSKIGEIKGSQSISTANPDALEIARAKMLSWKANKCLFDAYGGGHVHESIGAVIVQHFENKKLVTTFGKVDGFMIPPSAPSVNPLNAHIAHYDRMIAEEKVVFPLQTYRESFYGYARNAKLKFVEAEQEREAINRQYWLTPYLADVSG